MQVPIQRTKVLLAAQTLPLSKEGLSRQQDPPAFAPSCAMALAILKNSILQVDIVVACLVTKGEQKLALLCMSFACHTAAKRISRKKAKAVASRISWQKG